MRPTLFLLLTLGMFSPVLSQPKMYINKIDGTTDSLPMSDVKSITFTSDFSTTTPPPDSSGMVQVTGGIFLMGSLVSGDEAMPTHQVKLGLFSIDKYETTYEQWERVFSWGYSHGYTDLQSGQNGHNPSGTKNPVTNVDWYNAVKWCNARSEMEGLTPVYYTNSTLTTIYRTGQADIGSDAVSWTANGYRLPTEAEWEFAARGGTASHSYTYSGSNALNDVAWYNSAMTHTVGTKSPNELGIYDMTGNVWEWCWDLHGNYPSSAQTNPTGPPIGTYRTIRGGGINNDAVGCHVALRNKLPMTSKNSVRGFRCVKK